MNNENKFKYNIYCVVGVVSTKAKHRANAKYYAISRTRQLELAALFLCEFNVNTKLSVCYFTIVGIEAPTEI